MRERFLFKLAGIALVARMEAFADIMGTRVGRLRNALS